MGWLTVAQIGLGLFNGLRSSSQAKESAAAGSAAAQYNAQQASYFGQLNANAMMEAAGINAGMTMAIGELNAGYIERAGERNLALYGIQSAEELRRHIRAEYLHNGSVRAAQSGTGIQVNTGANVRYYKDQVDEGLRQRNYMMTRHAETKKSIRMDFEDRAYVTRESASLQAEAIMANGAISADMAIAEAQFQSGQYTQQAAQYQQAGQQASSNALWGTLGSVGQAFIGSEWGQNAMSSIGSSFFGGNAASSAPTFLRQSSANTTPVYNNSWFNSTASNFMGSIT